MARRPPLPLRRRLRRWGVRLGALVALFFAVYTIVFLAWNDERIARSISHMPSDSLRGGGKDKLALQLGRAHYPYWGGLASVLFGRPVYADVWDSSITDVDGREIMFIPHAHGAMYVRETLWSQVASLFPGARWDLELHFTDADVDRPRCRIALDSEGKINLPGAFTAKVQKKSTGGLHVRVDGVRVHDADFTIEMPGWRGEAHHVEAAATLSASTFPEDNPPGRVMLVYNLSALSSTDGELVLGTSLDKPFRFPLRDLAATRFAAQGPATEVLRFEASAIGRGADARVRGDLHDIYGPDPGVDLTIGFEHGRELLTMLPTGDLLGGDPRGEVRIHGPFRAVQIDGRAENGSVHVVGLTGEQASARFALAGSQLTLSDADVAIGGGRVRGSVAVDFAKLEWQADLASQRVDPAKLLALVPPPARPILAGRLDGSAHLGGSLAIHPERIRVRRVAATLERARRDQLPRTVSASGGLRLAPDRIDLDGLALRGDGVTATAQGAIDPRQLTSDGKIVIDSPQVGKLLARLGVAASAGALHARAHVRGALVQPIVDGDLFTTTVGDGRRLLPRLDAHLHLERGTLTASRLVGTGPLGGKILGEASLGLFDGPFTRPRLDPTLHVRVSTEALALEAIAGSSSLQGELRGQLELDGSLDHPRGLARLEVPQLVLYGDPYRAGRLDVAVRDDGSYEVERLQLERVRGGTVSGRGTVGRGGRTLDLHAQLDAFPVAAIPMLRDVPVAMAGTLNGALHVGGDLHHWRPTGAVEAAAVRIRDTFLGDGRLDLRDLGGGDALALQGDFFRRFKVNGSMRLYPHVGVDVQVAFDDFPLEELIPELKKLAEVHGVASGVATLSYDVTRGLTEADLRLSKLVLSLTGEEEDEHGTQRHTDEFANDGDVIISTDGAKLTFVQAKLRSKLGGFAVSGDLSPTVSDLRVDGRLELQLLEYFFSSLLQHTHGDAIAHLRIQGAAARPRVTGTLDLQGAELEPRGAERPFKVPSGSVIFEPGVITLHQLRARLDDAEALAEARVQIAPDWTPGQLSAQVDGTISPTLIAWLFPDHVGEASGRLEVSARVGGKWPNPTWQGHIDVKNLAFHEKRLGRDVRIAEGTIQLHQYDLTLGCPTGAPGDCRSIRGKIDETGDVRIDGVVSLPGLELGRVKLRFAGDNLEWASPGIYSMTVAPDVTLSGNGEHLKLNGTLVIVAGRYKQDFSYQDLLIRPRAVEVEAPFYEGMPLLEGLELELVASSSGALAIKNNLADLNVSFQRLAIGGTLTRPTLDGTISVEEGGHFQFPFLRADFISDRSEITFEPQRGFPEETPRLDIKAQSDWTDRYEQVHHLMLTIIGTYKEPYVDLTSSDGWNKTQVLFAITTGGAPDDVRRSLQNDPSRGSAGRSGADPVLKTVSGQFISGLIEDPLKSVFHLDTARLELGSDSVQIRLCFYNTRYVKLCGNADVGFVLTSRYDVAGQFKLTDDLSFSGAVEHIQHGVDTIEDILTRGKLQLVWRHPFH